MTRVLIAAASPVVRAGLLAVLAESGRVEVAASGFELEALPGALAREQPDVVLFCVRGEAEEALAEDLLAPESERPLAPPCVCLTDRPHATWIREHLGGALRGVLPLDAEPPEILAAIEAAAAGLTSLPSEEVVSLLDGRAQAEAFRPPEGARALSPREVEVLQMIAEGLPNKMIAGRLSISEHTVKFHVASILEKLGAESRTEAVTRGLRSGVIFL